MIYLGAALRQQLLTSRRTTLSADTSVCLIWRSRAGFAARWLLLVRDTDKDIKILALRHQLAILQRRTGKPAHPVRPGVPGRPSAPATPLPAGAAPLDRLPETMLRWHHDPLHRRHAKQSRPKRPGRPPTLCSIKVLVLRLARENPS
jgi:hypothetical protein